MIGSEKPIAVAIIPPPAAIDCIFMISCTENDFCLIFDSISDIPMLKRMIVGAIHGPNIVATEIYDKIKIDKMVKIHPNKSTKRVIFLVYPRKNSYYLAK